MSLCRPYTNPDPAACPLNRLARRTYTVTARTSRCRVTSMMRVSSTLRSAAVVTKPARSECPENCAGSSPAAVAAPLMERMDEKALTDFAVLAPEGVSVRLLADQQTKVRMALRETERLDLLTIEQRRVPNRPNK